MYTTIPPHEVAMPGNKLYFKQTRGWQKILNLNKWNGHQRCNCGKNLHKQGVIGVVIHSVS